MLDLIRRGRIDAHRSGWPRHTARLHQPARIHESRLAKIAGEDRVDKPELHTSIRIHGSRTDDQIERLRCADQPGHALRAPCARDNPERHFRKSAARTGRRHAVVAGERKFQATAKYRTVYRTDDRDRQIFDPGEQLAIFGFFRRPVELSHVGA